MELLRGAREERGNDVDFRPADCIDLVLATTHNVYVLLYYRVMKWWGERGIGASAFDSEILEVRSQMASDGTDEQNILLQIYNRYTLNHNALAHVNLCKGSAFASGWSTLAVYMM
jgi:hypothetical protein